MDTTPFFLVVAIKLSSSAETQLKPSLSPDEGSLKRIKRGIIYARGSDSVNSRQIHINALDLRIAKKVGEALVAANAAVFVAAVGDAGEVPATVVDPDVPGLNLRGEAIGRGKILRPDAGREAEGHAVRHFDEVVRVLPLEHGLHRPEDFFLRQTHAVVYILKDRWHHEVAVL